ncbi:hypothetical protein [Anaerocolumna chitinilytica]|uniref:Uncharacterized protein n=1 Tax=Anaerocolumna chitinilytica TaxID=1727145 RepID=A0A7I8DXW8_9FIRM|nr:hypothetical protein [Anaerocolumna chitinilytica]BCK01087.1 hypothetical protein bsdcttw_41270 [Anaerocolumna chitinilytica]
MNNVINWLLKDDTPEVKYRTMTELLGMPKDEVEVKNAYENLLSSKRLSLVMEKLKLNKKWEDINAFLALTEFGLTRIDVSIDDYIERIIKNMNMSTKCAKILVLRNLVSLGYYEHPWVQEQIPLVFSTIRQDGTVRCLDKSKKTNDSKLLDMGCYRQTTTYLLLAAELKKIGIILPQFELLLKFYLNNYVVFHSNDSGKVIIKDMVETFYPIDHVHIGLHMIMYGLSVLGVANHPNCEKAWVLLDSKKDFESKYILSESFAEPYFDVGMVGQPNKWVTLYVLLSEKYRTK